MQSDDQTGALSPETLKRKHESRNPPVRWILFVGGLVMLVMAVCFAVIWLMMINLSAGRPPDTSAPARGLVAAPNLSLLNRFPPPHLQINPHDELTAFRAHEEAELNSYGWVDRSNGIVRIPIKRAMELIGQRGLPARAANRPANTGKSRLELIQERSQRR